MDPPHPHRIAPLQKGESGLPLAALTFSITTIIILLFDDFIFWKSLRCEGYLARDNKAEFFVVVKVYQPNKIEALARSIETLNQGLKDLLEETSKYKR